MSNDKKSHLWEFFIDNYKFTYVALFCVILLGTLSIRSMPKESSPEIEVPIAVVTTVYPGANAQDVEELVTDPIEDRINGLDELDEFTSVSKDGVSSITVQFEIDADADEKIADLKDAIDNAKIDLPDDAEDPIVTQIAVADQSVLTMALSGPYSSVQIKNFAEELKDEIEAVPGVSTVRIIGGQDREYQVIVSKAKLDEFGLALTDVTGAIRSANTDIPAGTVTTGISNYTLRLEGRFQNVEDIASVPIRQLEGSPILVSDVGRVIDGLSKASTQSRLSVSGSDPEPSITLLVFKRSGGNIIDITRAIESKIESVQKAAILPENLTIAPILKNADYIERDLGNLTKNGIQTIILIFLLLYFFLGVKEAVLAGLSIPLTFFVGFIILSYLGYTLNFLTLFSLILSLGVLVDSAIVITEAIYVNKKEGLTAKESARKAIREFRLPLIAGVLTTVFAFLPMKLSSGIVGKFIETIPVTVSSVLIGSLFVALGIITTLASRMLREKPPKQRDGKQGKFLQRFSGVIGRIQKVQAGKKEKIQKMYDWYGKKLSGLLYNKKEAKKLRRRLILAFVGAIAMVGVGIVRVNMFPPSDFPIMFIDVEKPLGTPLDVTSSVLPEIEDLLVQDSRIESFVTNVGSSSGDGSVSSNSSLGSTHLAHFVIKLHEQGKLRKTKSYDLVDEYTDKLAYFDKAKIRVWQQSDGPPSAAPVEVVIQGDDIAVLESIAGDYEELVKSIENTKNVKTNIQDSPGEFVLTVDRVKAQLYGANTLQIAQTLRNAVSGVDATIVRKDGEDIDVLVKYDLAQGSEDDPTANNISLDSISAITIATPQGDIPLSAFTKNSLQSSRSQIQHEDGQRIVKVTSETLANTPAQVIFAEIEKRQDEVYVPDGYVVKLGGEREDIDKSFSDMFKAMFLAIFLIAALLVWQFQSYRQPLFILITIPLAFIGVIPGLFLVGLPLSFPGVIGVVALAGIVVNNAIILIDRINENRREGMDKTIAVLEGSKMRLQPILLTTITTIAGVAPLAISDETWGPLAYSIIFGLLFSTVSSLIVIPLLYNRYAEEEIS
ncbi:efflux RND transporter permease subunit [Candidatus Nomurabacteria bacterium]|nr:efflux RND transporter permease subunit [Candidatus Nomurabacteria bacterium]